jgi:pyruvate/2-oxoglutarate dehydrogenase complex dihydrolipoamide acyltransferase (E2) component
MRIEGQTLLAQARTESSRITVVPVSALLDAGDVPAAEIAKTVDTLRAMGGMSARVMESNPGNVHVLDFSGTRVTLKLAQSYAPGELLAVILAASPGAKSNAGDVKLSASGQLIQAALTADAAEEAAASTPALATGAPTDAGALASALRKAVQDTGIFYESHLATWMNGRTSLEALRQEPKARLGQTQDPAEPFSPPLAALVRRQLDALENRSAEWRGTLWPGQAGELAITEERSTGMASTASAWSTRIRLTLPNLGEIDARISLSGKRVKLDMDASASAVAALRTGGAELRDALSARGLAAERLEVKSHD